jgi:hypothetical protein
MALIEIEMSNDKFNLLIQALGSAAPIPIGVLNALGPSRLIAEFTWGQVEVGPIPPGFNPPFGTLTARCDVTMRHVSTAELDVDPNATGIATTATAWIQISTSTVRLKVELLAMEVVGAPLQWLLSPVLVSNQTVPIDDDFTIVAAALIMRDEVVTLRFATRPTDSLQSTPLNLIADSSDEWGIRLSNEFFTEQLLEGLQLALTPPPAGTSIEDSAGAVWANIFNEGWKVYGHVGLEKKDACPGLIEDTDISIGVDITLEPSANLTATPPQLILTLRTSSDVSDWDAFRCWLGSGGIFSSILGYLGTAIVSASTGGLGFLVSGIISMVKVGEALRLGAGKELKEINVDDFTLVSSSSTSATYSRQIVLPSLVATVNGISNGSISPVTLGPFGMLISGTISILGATHNRSFTPNGGVLTSALRNSFDCGPRTWLREADIQTIGILDRAIILNNDLGRVPVTVFYSTIAVPGHLWSVEVPAPALSQSVKISGSELVKAGDTGRVYLHTSAGIRRFDITPLPATAEITEQENIAAVAQCFRRSRMFTALEEIQWLSDPPPYHLGFPPLRQWMFTFSELPNGTHIKFFSLRNGLRSENTIAFISENAGQGSVELITDAATDVILEHNQETIANGRIMQRWIIPTEMIDTDERGQRLSRYGSVINVIQKGGIFSHDVSTGLSVRQAGEIALSKSVSERHKVTEETRRPKDIGKGSITKKREQPISEIQGYTPLFSLTLPGGKVAALFENKLVIGIPWQQNRVIMPED